MTSERVSARIDFSYLCCYISSMTAYIDVKDFAGIQNVDSDGKTAAGDAAYALTDDTDYTLQNTGLDKDGYAADINADIYILIGQSSAPTDEARAMKSAVILKIGGTPMIYTPVASQNAYVWSPRAPTTLSISPS